MRILFGGVCALFFAGVVNGEPLEAPASCESLAALTMPNAAIVRPVNPAECRFLLPTNESPDENHRGWRQGSWILRLPRGALTGPGSVMLRRSNRAPTAVAATGESAYS